MIIGKVNVNCKFMIMLKDNLYISPNISSNSIFRWWFALSNHNGPVLYRMYKAPGDRQIIMRNGIRQDLDSDVIQACVNIVNQRAVRILNNALNTAVLLPAIYCCALWFAFGEPIALRWRIYRRGWSAVILCVRTASSYSRYSGMFPPAALMLLVARQICPDVAWYRAFWSSRLHQA